MTIFLFAILCTFACRYQVFIRAQSDDYEYVQAVLEEDELYGDDDDASLDELQYKAQQEEILRQRQEVDELRRREEEQRHEEENRIAREAVEKLQKEKDETFERELKSLNEQQQKIARKQKKRDSRTVELVLRAARSENYYEVLGLRNWEIRIPPRQVKVGSFALRIPGFSLFHISTGAIRKAYRSLSRAVHPDKNRNARAEEAFIAVENAATVLSEEDSRSEYDQTIWEVRRENRRKVLALAKSVVDRMFGASVRAVAILRKILGPFSFPVFLLGLLIV
jgi:hypothetical protein